ncbi:MAG: LPS export ABC transporter periplasmic protein LptC [Bacteroidaceae bacterium]|nr:LPS export ABC transporter periplasmic protein LptC [Bacteroidaceae bacterium]
MEKKEGDRRRYVASSDEDRGRYHSKSKTNVFYLLLSSFIFFCLLPTPFSCTGEVEHLADPISGKDSLLFMHSRGINTFISDSGVIRYHLVVEEWDIYNGNPGEPTTWKFMKGLLMERYDEKFHVDLFVQSDTAYLHKQQLWELRGRVVVRNVNGDVFHTEELFWDLDKHEMWNKTYMHISTPERELEGTEFHSNEQMTRYTVFNSVGSFPVTETSTAPASGDSLGTTRGRVQEK